MANTIGRLVETAKKTVTKTASSETIARQLEERRAQYQQRQAELSSLQAQYVQGEAERRKLHIGQELDGQDHSDALKRLDAAQERLQQAIKQKGHALDIEPTILDEIEQRYTAARVDEANQERRQLSDTYWALDKQIKKMEPELYRLKREREAAYEAERALRFGQLLANPITHSPAPTYIELDDN